MKLIFIYNADSGLFNTLTDIAHKMFSPSSYSCQLCAITHSYFSMRDEWRQVLEQFDAELEFLHRDEFIERYPQLPPELPAIYLVNNNSEQPELLVDRETINGCQTIDELKLAITSRLVTLTD